MRRKIVRSRAASRTRTAWAMPAITAAQTSIVPWCSPSTAPRPGMSSVTASASRPVWAIRTAPIRMTLSSTGAAAAAANRPSEFSTPDRSAATEMNRM